LRVCEGQLLDMLLEGLFIATDCRVLQTYKLARFDQIPRPLKSALKNSNIEVMMICCVSCVSSLLIYEQHFGTAIR
jgi:hypothetical protein